MTSSSRERIIGQYLLESRLGRGGMGEVHRARHLETDALVALKILPPGLDDGKDRVRRFLREIRLHRKLDHPNLVQVHEAFIDEETPFLVMELVEGKDLHHVLEETAPLGLLRVCSLVRQMAQGLSHLHERGIVHRDLKPRNVLLTPQDVVKIVDFGLAKGDGQTDITEANEIVGTLAYLSPEVVSGQPATASSDAWALGLMIFQMTTGALPYRGANMGDWAQKITGHRAGPASDVKPDLPAEIDHLVIGLLDRDPTRRLPLSSVIVTIESLEQRLLGGRKPAGVEIRIEGGAGVHPGEREGTGIVPIPAPATASPARAEIPDDELMRRTGDGEIDAFDQLVRRHQRQAWSLAYGFFGSSAPAADAVQNAFLKIFLEAGHYEPRGRFRGYLRTILTRICLNASRDQRVALLPETGAISDPRSSPSTKVVRRERRELIRQAIAGLPATQRMALTLRYFEDLDHVRISEHMGLSPKAVERLLWRARKNLSVTLEGVLGTEGS